MALPLGLLLGGSLLAKGIGGLFGNKAKKKKADESKRATVAGLNLQQKQKEDARRARLQLGASLLNGVPHTTAGGGVNTNVGLDPELVKALNVERTYDFGSAVPDESAGGGSAFLSGLFGGIGDTIPYMTEGGRDMMAGGGGAGPGGVNTNSVNSGLSIDDLMRFLNTKKATPAGAPPPGEYDWAE